MSLQAESRKMLPRIIKATDGFMQSTNGHFKDDNC